MTVGLPKTPDLHRERRLVAGLAPEAFDRVEDRGLFAADVRPAAAPDLDVEPNAVPHDVGAKEARAPAPRRSRAWSRSAASGYSPRT